MKTPKQISIALLFCLVNILGISNTFAAINTSKPEYLNGGVGEEDLEKMRKVAKNYPLRIVFTEGAGAYVANVIVGIYDQADNLVFYKKNSGPYLYVKLPDGDYKVVAIYKGEKRSHKMTLDVTTSKKIFFNWTDPNETSEPLSEDATEESSTPKTP